VLEVDRGAEFREEASLAKYLAVDIARKAAAWSADMFGAASVMRDHPIPQVPHGRLGFLPGEGTQMFKSSSSSASS